MIGVLVLVAAASVWIAKLMHDEARWLRWRMDYWYEQARFWREMWEAERTGDYQRLAEIHELRRLETSGEIE